MFKRIVLVLLIGNFAYAEDSVYLTKGQSAPYDGILSPKEKIQELRNASIERDTYKAINDSLKVSIKVQQDTIDFKDKQLKIVTDQNDKLSEAAYKSQSLNNWERAALFAGGILVTGIAVKLAHDIYNK